MVQIVDSDKTIFARREHVMGTFESSARDSCVFFVWTIRIECVNIHNDRFIPEVLSTMI